MLSMGGFITLNSGLASTNVRDVYVDSRGYVYAATTGGLAISLTNDASNGFRTITSGLGSTTVNGVYVVGDPLASQGIIYAATMGGLSYSTDGINFTNITSGLGSTTVLGVYADDGIIYAATAPVGPAVGGLSYSTDGTTFTNITTGLASPMVKRVYANDSGIYAATGAGVSFASVTNGTGVVTGSAAFTDPAGRTLTYSTTGTSTGGGAVSIDAATGAFIFTPTADQRAVATADTTDAFTITASNGVNTREQTVSVTVAAQ
jgi:hypothetical protein